jgi:hypothetical protein
MKLSCGFMTIDLTTIDSKTKKLSFNGQICVDGIETFLVKDNGDDRPRVFYPYGNREDVYKQVFEHYGDTLNEVIDELIIEKSKSVKEAKKNLTKLRKEARENAGKKKKVV